MIDLSVIVVCHNDHSVVERCNEELGNLLPTLGLKVELIYVDNGSTDDTALRLGDLVRQEQFGISRKLVVLRRYSGFGQAFMAGVEHSQGDLIATLDAALTVDPVEIIRMVEEIELGYDLVIGWRIRNHLPNWVQWRSRVMNQIASFILGVDLHDYGTPLRLMRREAVVRLVMPNRLYPYLPVFVHMAGGKLREILVIYRPDNYIRPEYTAGGYFYSFLDLLTVWVLSRYGEYPMMLFGQISAVVGSAAFLTLLSKQRRLGFELLALAGQILLWGLGLELFLNRTQETHSTSHKAVIEVIE